jgi:tRNA(Ile)-lysidine synthase
MRSEVDKWLGEIGTKTATGFVLNAAALEKQKIGLVRRILRSALREAGSSLQDVSFAHIEAVRHLLERDMGGKVAEVPGGIIAAREFDQLAIRYQAAEPQNYDYELKIPGCVHIPELNKLFVAEIIDREGNQTGSERVFVDGGSIGPCVRIRNWKPGDHYRPVGLPAGKLKKLFQRARIPRSQRTSWPVIVSGTAIVWVASFPVSREFAPCGRSQKIVAFEAVSS